MITRFDPFEDRLSRDIRNDLSAALRGALAVGEKGPFREAVAAFLARGLGAVYDAYLRERVARYERALEEIGRHGVESALDRALILWDLGLFFECHEVLEAVWMHAAGPYKWALQGLIRAAGVYVHLEAGHWEAARKMAAKAVSGLEEHGAALGHAPWLERLLISLRSVDPAPPRLRQTQP